MKHLVSLLILLLSLSTALPQGTTCKEDLIPRVGKNRLYGYSDLFGNWKVIPFYTRVFPFSGNVAVVQKGLKYGVINCEGKVVLRPVYQEIKTFVNGFSWVRQNDKWGLINQLGEIILEPIYDDVDDVSRFSDYAWVLQGEKWGLFNKESRQFIFKTQFSEVKKLTVESALVRLDGKLGVVKYDENGYVKTPQFDAVSKINGAALLVKKGVKYGLINDLGKSLLPMEYEAIERVHQYRLKLKKDGVSYLADAKGRLLKTKGFEDIYNYSGGAFAVTHNGKYGYINYKGRLVIPLKYDHAYGFKKGRAIVCQEDSSFLINPSDSIVSSKYRRLKDIDLGRYVASNQKAGVIDENGEILLPLEYDSIYYEDQSSVIRLKKADRFHFFNRRVNKRIDLEVYDADPFTGNDAIVLGGVGRGVVDESGAEKIALKYDTLKRLGSEGFVATNQAGSGVFDSNYKLVGGWNTSVKADSTWPVIIQQKGSYALMDKKAKLLVSGVTALNKLSEDFYALRKGKKVGVVNSKGKEVIAPMYQSIKAFSERFFVVQQKGKWGYVDARNKVVIPFQFIEAEKFVEGKAFVRDGNESFSIDKKGRKIK